MTEANISIEELQSGDGSKALKIAHISGQLDESNIDEKIKDIYKLVDTTPNNLNLIFDLEKLEYMNSKSIGYLTDLYGKITDNGGQVVIANAKPNILDILNVVGLTQLIKTANSIEEAKSSISIVSSGQAAPAPAPAQVPAAAAPTPEPAPAQASVTVPTPAPEPTPTPTAPASPEQPPTQLP